MTKSNNMRTFKTSVYVTTVSFIAQATHMVKRVLIDTLGTILVATTKADGKARSACNS